MINNDQEILLELVGDIYEAGINPAHWSVALANLCQLLDAKSAGIFIKEYQTNTVRIEYAHALPKAVQAIYNLGLGKIDPSFKRMAAVPTGVSSNMLNIEYPEQPTFQRLVIKRAGIGYAAAMNIMDDKNDCYVGIALHRSPESQTFDSETLALFQSLFPHFQRSLRIQREFSRLRMRENALMQGLSHITFGVLVLDELGQPSYVNHVAQQIMKHHPAISLRSKGVVAHSREQNIALQNTIIEVANSTTTGSKKSMCSLGLTHPSSELPLAVMLMLMPLRDSGLEQLSDNSPGKVLMVMSDHEHSTLLSPDALQGVFKFTNAETRVVVALVNGLTVEQIANQNDVKPSTVKSHLKNVFGKTGVNRQQDLIRLVLSGPYSVAGSHGTSD